MSDLPAPKLVPAPSDAPTAAPVAAAPPVTATAAPDGAPSNAANAIGASTPGAAPKNTGTSADERETAFHAVQGGTEMQSGEKLLVEAYSAIWLILFAMILLSWRRQRRIDERVTHLEAALDAHRHAGAIPAPAGAAAKEG